MTVLIFYILLVLNVLIYGVSLVFVLRNKTNSVFSIRSPLLLLVNNLGGFLMTTTILIYHIVAEYDHTNNKDQLKTFCNMLPDNYIIFHCMFYFSFALRCDRLIKTCQIRSESVEELKKFQSNQESYMEVYYAKILLITLGFISILSIGISILSPDYSISPYQFDVCHIINEAESTYLSMIWITIGFIENMILITYCSKIIFTNKLTFGVKVELIIFTGIWFLYQTILRLFEKEIDIVEYNQYTISTICIVFLWICLILNSYLPYYYVLTDEQEATYNITPELLNNMFIFLSNENCLKAFYKYINKIDSKQSRAKAKYTLKLYTKLQSFRLYFSLEDDYNKVFLFNKTIMNDFIFNPSKELQTLVSTDVIDRLNLQFENNDNNEIYLEQYDDLISVCYNYLKQIFEKFKITDEYQSLYKEVFIQTYIHNALMSVGLINKYN